mmetsp:Transcript_26538/g.39326  ORF Transcript_26538/g.39326 Transcript_26538/m.39326 type:complete len:245 (-) Transcript_26538:893-1627(-)
MEVFSKCFHETISQRLTHDLVVVIVLCLVFYTESVASKARNSKHTQVILMTLWCNEICLTQIRIVTLLFSLLTEHAEFMKYSSRVPGIFILIEVNIFAVVTTICSKHTNNSLQIHALISDDLLHESLSIVKELNCFTSNSVIVENFRVTAVWIASSKLPGLKKGIPVDVRDNIFQTYCVDNRNTKLLWCGSRGVGVKVNLELLLLRFVKIKEVSILKTSVVVLSQLFVLLLKILYKLSLILTKQ